LHPTRSNHFLKFCKKINTAFKTVMGHFPWTQSFSKDPF
jgi:hypothetical protein